MDRIVLSLCTAVLLTTAGKADDQLIRTSGLQVGDKVVLRELCVCDSRCGAHRGEYILVAGEIVPEWLGLGVAGQRVRAELLIAERRLFEASKANKNTPGSIPELEMISLKGAVQTLKDEALQTERIDSRPKTWTIIVVSPGAIGLEAETKDGRTQMFIPLDRVRTVVRHVPAKLQATGKPKADSK